MCATIRKVQYSNIVGTVYCYMGNVLLKCTPKVPQMLDWNSKIYCSCSTLYLYQCTYCNTQSQYDYSTLFVKYYSRLYVKYCSNEGLSTLSQECANNRLDCRPTREWRRLNIDMHLFDTTIVFYLGVRLLRPVRQHIVGL